MAVTVRTDHHLRFIETGLPFATAVSGDGTYLVDQNGQPWFGVADTAWSLGVQLTAAEVTTYLEDRAAKGFNLSLFNAPEGGFSNQTPPERNVNGDLPFTGTAYQSSLNEPYWEHIDFIFDEMERLGFTVIVCMTYLGFNLGDGWRTELAAATNGQVSTYATSLAQRYADRPNLIWLIGHDFDPDATLEDRQANVATALRANSGFLVAPGGLSGSLGSTFYPGITFDLDTIYDYGNTPAADTETAYAASAIPVGFFEGHYEADFDHEDQYGDEPYLRSQMWGPFVGGACYVLFGNNPIWHFEDASWGIAWTGTWESNLDSPGSLKLEMFAQFIIGLGTRWSTMLPLGSTFVTTGRGSGGLLIGARVDTAATSGTLAVVYRPSGGAATVGLNVGMLAPTNCEVFKVDPVNLAATSLGVFATTGSQSFGSLGTNAAGDGDWVLVVEAA